MLSRLQPAFILIPRVETSQGGSSPLRVLLYRSTSGGFRLDSPFFTHTRAHATHAHARTHRCRSGLSLPLPPPATLHASHPRPYPPLLAPTTSRALPFPRSLSLTPSLSLLLSFFPSIRRYEYTVLLYTACFPSPRSRIQARVFSGLTCFLRVHTSKQLPKQ